MQVTVTKDDTIILDGAGSKDDIQERCGHIRDAAVQTTSDYDRDKLHERLAKLSGGVAVLKIGGASEVCSNVLQMIPRTAAAYFVLDLTARTGGHRTASHCLRVVPAGAIVSVQPFQQAVP
jgi:hypothetical protein